MAHSYPRTARYKLAVAWSWPSVECLLFAAKRPSLPVPPPPPAVPPESSMLFLLVLHLILLAGAGRISPHPISNCLRTSRVSRDLWGPTPLDKSCICTSLLHRVFPSLGLPRGCLSKSAYSSRRRCTLPKEPQSPVLLFLDHFLGANLVRQHHRNRNRHLQ